MFDPDALVAILRAFYPVVSVATLRRARAERPESFAGGELFGTHGEKLRLLDGRVYDLIFDVDGPGAAWQAIDVSAGGPETVGPYPLEPGPLGYVDVERFPLPIERHDFEQLVGQAALALGDVDGRLVDAETTIASESSPAPMIAAYERDVGRAGRGLEGQRASVHALDISDVVGETEGLGHVVGAREAEIPNPDEVPPDITVDDPGDVPSEEPPEPPEV